VSGVGCGVGLTRHIRSMVVSGLRCGAGHFV